VRHARLDGEDARRGGVFAGFAVGVEEVGGAGGEDGGGLVDGGWGEEGGGLQSLFGAGHCCGCVEVR